MPSDLNLHFVLARLQSGPSWVERDPADMDFKSTVADIASGDIENIQTVLQVNMATGHAVDVTEDVCRAVMTQWADGGEPLTSRQFEFVEMHVGFRAANSFVRAA